MAGRENLNGKFSTRVSANDQRILYLHKAWRFAKEPMAMLQSLARKIAHGPVLSRGRRLFAENSLNWNLRLSKLDKLATGAFVILDDYSKGLFPPRFEDQAKAYAAEVTYRTKLPGQALEDIRQAELRKPFWFAGATKKYLDEFTRLILLLEAVNLQPPSRLLEIGCGTGWMAEFLAIEGFDVTGTSIAPTDIEDARLRLNSIVAKGLRAKLRFEIAAMESVADTIGPRDSYDGVFVYEALHHAFDWRRALQSAFACLKPGGWLLVCNEPNRLHTFVSYRVAKLSDTHEIGFSRPELLGHLNGLGFAPVKYLSTRFHFWMKFHWIAAQKPR
jgi:2-polyprenyl-3-methyl-5-hydroxy-6-metoxy-1,4-benzoquinol methylase